MTLRLLIRRSTIILLFILLVRPACAANMWWVDFRRVPVADVMLGSPVPSFDPSWSTAELLSTSQTPGLPADVLEQLRDHGLGFSITTRSLRPGHRETLRVGVYKDTSGQSGSFVLVMENGRVLKVLPYPDEPGFSALTDAGGSVEWYFCMECGTRYRIVYEEGYFLE